ncbi:hypothetical protein JKP88DRAFT_297318 [Tribonema minus]|uniref:Uncharacterized protein n=1 Tax=Tribonema minus TaxID=303371 RepID=A0A835ZHU4_9STRA|nr:hypothetical protein JKP88DRAFT_323694 [Tribonema minus]KAG5190894.1 hypothetical protein JKP88DRAFT_297318 [Tribonema minus]
MEEERIRVPAPAGSLSQQEIVMMVFTSMAGRRLLPKKCWSLSRLLHDTVAPIIKVHLVADSINAATLHRLLEDTSRRNVQRLTLDGDFTSMQQRPLNLVPLLSPAVAQVDVAFCSFSGSIEDVLTIPSLPEGVASLSVTAGFSRDVVWAFSKLPQSLRHLIVDATTDVIVFEQPLPTLLESFIVESGGEVHVGAGSLPASLRNLQLWGFQQLYELPPRLRVLMLQRYIYPLPLLPDTLETLVLDYCTHHVSNLPDSVRSLALYWHPAQPAPPLPARWPAHLERLVDWAVGESEPDDAPEPCIDRPLPPTLTQLELNGCSIATDLPQTLQTLRLGRGFSQELDLAGSFKVTVNGRRYCYE